MKILVNIYFILFSLASVAQSPTFFNQYDQVDTLDPLLTKSRSLVILATPQKDGEWKDMAQYLHKSFRVMGIDAINYIHYLDYSANPSIESSMNQYANNRQVGYYIIVEKREVGYRAAIISRKSEEKSCWYTEGENLKAVVLNLAITLKRTEHQNQNFLISVAPEYLTHLPLFEGTRYPNYPDRIRRMRMAIFEIPELAFDSSYSDQQKEEITRYNLEVKRKNEFIREQVEKYPYKLDILPMQEEKELYRQGYQYVLYYLNTSAESIRNILAYETTGQEEYISQLTLPDGKRTLKSYPAEKTLYKWYIKQTAVSDIHTGRYWDAHDNFESSLEHLFNRIISLLE